MKRSTWFLLTLFTTVLAALVIAFGCAATTTSSSSPADDDDNDDTSPVDDDDDNDDNDSPGVDCTTVAQDVVGGCQVTLDDGQGNPVTQAEMVTWCQDCDQLFNSGPDPFWNCMDNCAVTQGCSTTCFDGCLQPVDPGTGCGHTAYALYACDVAFTFPNTNYYVPLLDEMAYCPNDTADNWSCFATCVSNNRCWNPPSTAQTNALIACLQAC